MLVSHCLKASLPCVFLVPPTYFIGSKARRRLGVARYLSQPPLIKAIRSGSPPFSSLKNSCRASETDFWRLKHAAETPAVMFFFLRSEPRPRQGFFSLCRARRGLGSCLGLLKTAAEAPARSFRPSRRVSRPRQRFFPLVWASRGLGRDVFLLGTTAARASGISKSFQMLPRALFGLFAT